MGPKILVIEDESSIADNILYALKTEGFASEWFSKGSAALEALRERDFDLALLDLGLPDINGFELFKEIKKIKEMPIIFLTARSEEIDRVLGFELGADDYVTKPFSIRELALRVRALLKRGAPAAERERRVLQAGPILLDLESHRVEVREEVVVLTITEFRLLADLVKARGRVRTREALLSEVWGYDSEVLSRTVDTHVRRLRAKLGPAADWLRTIRGVGYRLDEPNAD
jgi:two-component system, OmpR family, phosphate regulon response regulator PhoB